MSVIIIFSSLSLQFWICQTQNLTANFNAAMGNKFDCITKNKHNEFFLSYWRVLPSAVLFSPISSLFFDDLQQQFQQNLNLIWSQKNEINERIAYFKCFLLQLQYEIINFVHYTNDRKLKCKTNKINKNAFFAMNFLHFFCNSLI